MLRPPGPFAILFCVNRIPSCDELSAGRAGTPEEAGRLCALPTWPLQRWRLVSHEIGLLGANGNAVRANDATQRFQDLGQAHAVLRGGHPRVHQGQHRQVRLLKWPGYAARPGRVSQCDLSPYQVTQFAIENASGAAASQRDADRLDYFEGWHPPGTAVGAAGLGAWTDGGDVGR